MTELIYEMIEKLTEMTLMSIILTGTPEVMTERTETIDWSKDY